MVDVRRHLKGTDLDHYSLEAAERAGLGSPGRLPITVKTLLEMLLRQAEERRTSEASVRALARWPEPAPPEAEVPTPPPASCSRTSPASPPWSTWRPCARPCGAPAGTPT
jgi:hypothetical protein